MQELIHTLYRHAISHQLETYLAKNREALEENEAMCVSTLERLRAALSPALWERVERYVYGRDMGEDVRGEALFVSGLAAGLSLGRLTL